MKRLHKHYHPSLVVDFVESLLPCSQPSYDVRTWRRPLCLLYRTIPSCHLSSFAFVNTCVHIFFVVYIL